MPSPLDWDGLVIGPTMNAFGEPVIYTAAGFLPLPIQAVFFRSSMQLLPMGGSGGQGGYLLGAPGDVTSREPMLGVQLSQFVLAQPDPAVIPPAAQPATPSQGDLLAMPTRSLVYEVKEVLPDGVGHARLTLTLISAP